MHSKMALSAKAESSRPASLNRADLQTDDRLIYLTWCFFAVVLAVVTRFHDIYLDEAQAWLIARDSRGLLDLCRHLHYEGHPALWYLILYIPAHLSGNVAWMKVINYALSLLMAGLILSSKSVSIGIRTLLVFSAYILFYMGVVERSYMLAGVLLVAASRCLAPGSNRHWLGIALLGLAINTHVLAIPVVVGIVVWLYWLAPNFDLASAQVKLREARFWISAGILLLALGLAFLTARPAPNVDTPQLSSDRLSRLEYLAQAIGYVWHQFVLYPSGWFSESARRLLVPDSQPTLLSVALTLILAGVGLWALPTRLARSFMLSVSLMWLAVVWAIVHTPSAFHCTFLFDGYLISLIVKFPKDARETAVSLSKAFLTLLLSMQVLTAFLYYGFDINMPFSGSKPTADWLEKNGLGKRPLVVESDLAAPPLLAYLKVDSAYFPSCRCQGSFLVYRKDREAARRVSSSELLAIKSRSGLSPLLIVSSNLGEPNIARFGMHLLYTSPPGWFWVGENLSVYGEQDVTALRGQESSSWIAK